MLTAPPPPPYLLVYVLFFIFVAVLFLLTLNMNPNLKTYGCEGGWLSGRWNFGGVWVSGGGRVSVCKCGPDCPVLAYCDEFFLSMGTLSFGLSS